MRELKNELNELKITIERLRDRLNKHLNESINPDLFDDTLFLIEKQNLYIEKLEGLLDMNN